MLAHNNAMVEIKRSVSVAYGKQKSTYQINTFAVLQYALLGPPIQHTWRPATDRPCSRHTRTSCRSCTGILQFLVTSRNWNIADIIESVHRHRQITSQHEHSRITLPVQRYDDNCHRTRSPRPPAYAMFLLLPDRCSLSSSSAVKATQRQRLLSPSKHLPHRSLLLLLCNTLSTLWRAFCAPNLQGCI